MVCLWVEWKAEPTAATRAYKKVGSMVDLTVGVMVAPMVVMTVEKLADLLDSLKAEKMAVRQVATMAFLSAWIMAASTVVSKVALSGG